MLNAIKKSSISLKLLLASFFLVLLSIPSQGIAQIDPSGGGVIAPNASTGPAADNAAPTDTWTEAMVNGYTNAPAQQDVVSGNQGQYLQFVADFIENIFGKHFLTLFVNSGLEISDAFHQWALALAGGLALASLFWSVLMAWVKRSPIIDPVLEVLLYAAIAAFGINYYRTLIVDIIALANGVMEYSGAGSVGNAVLDFYLAMLHPIFDSIGAIWDGFKGAGAFKVITSVINLLLATIAIIFALIAMRQLVTVFLLGPMFLSVGLALGPLFIATLASGFTRRWFDQWLNFVISSSMLTAMVALVLKIIAGVMRNVGLVGQSENGVENPGLMLGYALFCWALSGLLGAIPQIVDALFPGRTGAAGVKGGPPMPESMKKAAEDKINSMRKALNTLPGLGKLASLGNKGGGGSQQALAAAPTPKP